MQPDPPRSNALIHIQQAWFKLWTFLYSLFVNTGWSNTLFVDATTGNDDTAQRGSLTYSYATIQAALDAAQAGDVVWVSPGTYEESLTWPDTENITLRGVGDATNITSAAAAGTIAIAPTADVVTGLNILGLNILNSGVGACLSIDGAACPGLGYGEDIVIRDVGMTATAGTAVDVSICGDTELTNVNAGNDVITLSQTGRVLFNDCQFGTLRADNDPAGTEPTAGFDSIIMTATICGGVVLANISQFAGTDDVQIQGDFDAAFIDTATEVGSVNFSGRLLGDVQITFDLDDNAATVAVFDHARITGSFFCGRTTGGTGALLGTVRALNATFFSTGAGDITADSSAVLDIRGANFYQGALDATDTEETGAGVIDRTHWYVSEAAVGAGGSSVDFAIDYPTGADDYSVLVESDNVANQPAAITNKSETGFDWVDAAASGNIRFHVIRPFD